MLASVDMQVNSCVVGHGLSLE